MAKELMKEWLDESPEHARAFLEQSLILDVTEAICEALEKRQMSKTALAGRLGTSKAHVAQLLNGSRNMTFRTFAGIAFALDMIPTMVLTDRVSCSAQEERVECTDRAIA